MILGRSYLKEIGLHLLVVLGSLVFLVALGAAVQASSKSQGAPIWVPLTLIPLLIGNTLPYLVPVTLLVAVVLTYGRMASDGEAMALRAAGVRPLRMLGPALLAGLLAAAAVYPISSTLLPSLYTKMREVSFRLRFAALENTNPGSSELHYQGLHLVWSGRDRDGAFLDTLLYLADTSGGARAFPGDPGSDAPPPEAESGAGEQSEAAAEADAGVAVNGPLRVRAARTQMVVDDRKLIFHLQGMRFLDTRTEGANSISSPGTDSTWFQIDLDSLGERPDRQRKADDFSSAELRDLLEEGGFGKKKRRSYRFTLWRRLSMAMASVPLAVLGAVLGWRLRRGNFLTAFIVSFVVVIGVFYPLYYLGNALLKSDSLDALPAAWLPVAGLFAVLALLGLLGRRA